MTAKDHSGGLTIALPVRMLDYSGGVVNCTFVSPLCVS